MKLPALLLRFLPFWSYICPRCRREVPQNSHECPYCGEKYGKPLKVPPLCLRNKEALEKYVHEKIFPRISAKQRDYLAQYFTTLFEDGFESGDFSAWDGTYNTSGANLSVVSDNPHHGSYHARLTTTGENTYENAYVYKNLNEEPVVYCRAYFYFHDLSQDRGPTCISLRGNNYFLAYCRLKSSGASDWTLFYRNNGAEESVSTTQGFPSEDTWVCVELYIKVGDGDGEAKLYVDGTEILSVTGLANDDKGNVDRVEVGGREIGYNPTITIDFDCIVIADTYVGEEGGVTEVQISDSASGNETLSRPYRGLSLIDQASGQDIFSRPYREFPILESTLGQELLLKTRNLSLSDIAASLEVIQKGKQLGAITDVAQGLEQILKQRLISLLDQAAGFESIARPTRVIVMADEALGQEILSKLREVAAITDSAIGVEYINVGTEEAKKTKIFLLIGDLAIQVTGD